MRYVDTAPYYGVGQAERCVGDALRDRARSEWVLSTKVGRLLRPNATGVFADSRQHPLPFEAVYDYSYDGIMRSFEDSLQRLGLARIDILYVHDIGAYQHGAEAHPALIKTLRDSGYRALESLRSSGAVSAVGIGVNEREVLLEAMEWGAWDAFLLAGRYTLLEQAPLDDLLPKCVAAGTSIVVGGPLNSGILAGRETWNYRPAPPEVTARVKRSPPFATAIACRSRRRRCSSRLPIRRSPRSSRAHAIQTSSSPTSICCATRSRRRCGRICGRPGCFIPTPRFLNRGQDIGRIPNSR